MKRALEDDDLNENEKLIKESDKDVLKEIHDNLTRQDAEIQKELDDMKTKYYISFFKTTFAKVEACKGIMNTDDVPQTKAGCIKLYSFAKVCVNLNTEMQTIDAVGAFFDFGTSLLAKYIHEKCIVPLLKNHIPFQTLNHAFTVFQDNLGGGTAYSDLHKIAFVIQGEMEKKELSKLRNPNCERFFQQLIAASKYSTELFKYAAVTSMKLVEKEITKLVAEKHQNEEIPLDDTLNEEIPLVTR